MTPEQSSIPGWARQERQGDLAWIQENREVFWAVANLAFDDVGRGAIVVDTTIQPISGEGHPLAYFSQERVEEHGDQDTQRMVAEYDPTTELVLVLLKSDDRSSTYRVRTVLPEFEESASRGVALSHADEPIPEPRLEVPSIETLMEWEAEGFCEAACPEHCWVEPDGVCLHGHPSWLLKLGLIGVSILRVFVN